MKPVNLIENPKINEWLTMVEEQMRLTLACLLAKSVKDIQEFNSTNIDPKAYLQWVDSYQVGGCTALQNNQRAKRSVLIKLSIALLLLEINLRMIYTHVKPMSYTSNANSNHVQRQAITK